VTDFGQKYHPTFELNERRKNGTYQKLEQVSIDSLPAMSVSSKIKTGNPIGPRQVGSAANKKKQHHKQKTSLWKSGSIAQCINRVDLQAPQNAVVQSARVHAGSIVAYQI